jgi:hypothetical protein
MVFEVIVVHPRVNKRHPAIKDEDVIYACKHVIAAKERIDDDGSEESYFAIAGIDEKGRLLEAVGVMLDDNTLLVYHAMKLTEKMKKELDL